MDTQLLNSLADHQHKVREILARTHPLLDEEQACPDAMAVSRLRWELVRALAAYQQFKHRSIFDPMIMRGSPQLKRMSEVMKAACIAIGEDYTRHVQHWGTRGTSGHWPEYRQAALAMRERLNKHLDREEREVASLILADTGTRGTVPVAAQRR